MTVLLSIGYGRQFPYTGSKHESVDGEDFDYIEDYYKEDFSSLPQQYDYKNLLVDSKTTELKWSFTKPAKCKHFGKSSRLKEVVCMSSFSGGCKGQLMHRPIS